VGSALRKLVGASAVYGLGSVLVRGLAFLLLPVYTRYLSPAEYGVVALTVTCTVVLGMLYPLGLRGAVSRTYYEGGTVEERQERVGTLWIAMILSAAVMALLLDRLGPSLAAAVIPEIPFHPYLRLAVWTAFLGVLGLTPLVLLQAQERAPAFVLVTLGAALTTTAITVWLVVRGGGAAGYLQGALIGGAFAAVPYLALTLKQIRPVFRWSILAPALAFSLPLVPHALAGWALEMSDRAILTRLVPLHDVGVYSLGYQLGAAMGLVTTAFNAAWVPFLFGTLKDEGEAAHPKLARLVSYYAIALCFTALGLRAGEVARLTLDDVDGRAGRLTLAPGKTRRAHQLPLPAPLAAALVAYLQHGRPPTRSRVLFVHHRAQRGQPLGPSGVRVAVRGGYARAGLGTRFTGTHVLRHTAATRMLRAGVPLKEIADVLGHRSLDTSAIYAKVDLDALTAVALPWTEVPA
jgi:hypothetical protein